MTNKTKIEWTDARWNPITGCTKVSQGCKNCYAETIAKRFWKDRKFTDIRMHPERLQQPMKWKKTQMVFVNSMSDLFHEDVDFQFIIEVFHVMKKCPHIIFQILTKRADRLVEFMNDCAYNPYGDPFEPLPNVWIGVSVEDQKTADKRIPNLLKIPAAVHWISAEPLLDKIDLEKHLYPTRKGRMIKWVVVGGESGSKARPIHPDWVREIRNVCIDADVSFFFKQWGEWCPADGNIESCEITYLCGELQNGMETAVPLGMDNESSKNHYWDNEVFAVKIGKKKAGRLLDGKEWNEYPKV